jgi:hypothetical protein
MKKGSLATAVLTIIALSTLTLPAQQVESVDEVLAKAAAALGQKTAIESSASRTASGTFTSRKLNAHGAVKLTTAHAGQQLLELNIAGYGKYFRGYDGQTAWELYPGKQNAGAMKDFQTAARPPIAT